MSCGPSQVLCCLLCRSKCRKRFRFYFIFFYICLVPLAGFRRDAFRFDLFCFVTFASIVLFAVKFIAHFNAKKWSDVTSSHVILTRIHCSFGKSLFYEFYFIFIFASVRLRINKLNHAYFGFQLMQSNKKSRRIHFRICRRLSLTHQLIVDFHLDANEQYADRNKASVGNLNVTLIARQKRKMKYKSETKIDIFIASLSSHCVRWNRFDTFFSVRFISICRSIWTEFGNQTLHSNCRAISDIKKHPSRTLIRLD